MPTQRPGSINGVFSRDNLEAAIRVALASPFVIGGIAKLIDFNGTTEVAADLGFKWPAMLAIAAILAALVGSVLFLTRQYIRIGATILSLVTIVTMLLAHRFWTASGPDFTRQLLLFFEHAALVGGLACAAIHIRPDSP